MRNNRYLNIHNVFDAFTYLLVLVYIRIERIVLNLLAEVHMDKNSALIYYLARC